jgi:hypothetical protein
MEPSSASRYTTAVMGRLFAVRWRSFRLGDVASVRQEIASARRRVGHPLVYLSLIPASNRAFSAIEIVGLTDFVREILTQDCESIHHVIDGDGFIASARRSIITSIALASSHPKVFQVHASLEAAIGVIAITLGESAEELLTKARARDLEFPPKADAQL